MQKIFTLILTMFTATAFAAEEFIPYSIKAEAVVGYIYPHDKDVVSPIVKGPAIGGQIAFEWHTDGSRQWHLDFNRPTVGVALQVLDLSNPQKLGQMIAPYAYINIPMVRSRVVDFNFMAGAGFGFCTKPCDVEGARKDPRSIKEKAADYNFIIGSPFSFNLQAGLNLDFHVSQDVTLTLGVGYNHFSNGSLFQPNTGLNMFQGQVGVKYSPVI
ncbi:MAG: acyloxyacyl hydrolase, partial [Paludibacteraceae bacterium]|nr:acyloxyacyl hydrolase [Paludibacteraceae bacterium]